MSLIEKESRPCAVIIKASVDDGQGGQIYRYINGVHFSAVVTPAESSAKLLGNAEISAKMYKLFYPERIKLKLNDVVKTLDDDKMYKIKGLDTEPAKSATIRYNLASAEEWELPNE